MFGLAWSPWIQFVAHAFLTLFLNPIIYVATLLMIWGLIRQTHAERRFFGFRITRIWVPLFYRYLKSAFVGVILTLLALLLHVQVRFEDVVGIAILSVLFGLIRLRLSGTIYAITFLLLGSSVADRFPRVPLPATWIWRDLQTVNMNSLITLLALLFVGQFLLIAWDYRKFGVAPALVAGKRGREVGTMVLHWSFVVPIGMFIPGTIQLPPVLMSIHWLAITGLVAVAAMPAVIGWHGVVATRTPKQVATRIMLESSISAILLFAMVGAQAYLPVNGFVIVALTALVAIGIPEGHIWYTKWTEANRLPICPPKSDGLVVLFTIKGSVAEQIGLRMGEMITHVNQIPVHSEYDLHFALDQNPAYAKLQVVDARGEIRFVGKPVYAGERYQLGAVLVVQTGLAPFYRRRSTGLFQTLYLHIETPIISNIALADMPKTLLQL